MKPPLDASPPLHRNPRGGALSILTVKDIVILVDNDNHRGGALIILTVTVKRVDNDNHRGVLTRRSCS